MNSCGCQLDSNAQLESRTLRLLLVINASMFVLEAVAGWFGESAGLLADSLDMLADASVYAISLWAVGRAAKWQSRAAAVSGLLQLSLGMGVLVDVVRRYLVGSEPESWLIIAMGVIALAANVGCIRLLARHRHGGAHMQASWIFTTNDVIANLGVILSGGLVWALDSRLPDLLIGTLIAVVVMRGGVRILHRAWVERKAGGENASARCGEKEELSETLNQQTP